MYLHLTTIDDTKIRIKSELVEVYGLTEDSTFVETNSGKFYVKDTIEEIDQMLTPQVLVAKWK